MTIQMTTLDSGLRVITDHVPTVGSVAVGVWVGVGARDETPETNGVSHMVEHMLFKGTERRTAQQIAEEAENVGAHMNAYTSREVTAYYMHLLADHLPLAVDMLADMVLHSTMPDEEVARERGVIRQEIKMVNDTPDDLVFDLYQMQAYEGQMLGAPILGPDANIAAMARDTLMAHVGAHYAPSRMVVSAAGAVDHEAFVRMIEEQFAAQAKERTGSEGAARYTGGARLVEKTLEQCQVMVGFEGPSRTDVSGMYAAQMFGQILGGGMSSRLFQELREKRGLVYSTFSYFNPYQDTGQLMIYAGTGPDLVAELMPAMLGEITGLAVKITPEELARAKAHMRSQMLIGRESMKNRAGQQAKHLLFYDEVLNIEKRLSAIEALDAKTIASVGANMLKSKPTVAALGPLAKFPGYEEIQGRLAA